MSQSSCLNPCLNWYGRQGSGSAKYKQPRLWCLTAAMQNHSPRNQSKGSPASCSLWVVTRAPKRCWFTVIFPGCHVMMVVDSSFQCFHLEENFPFSTNVIECTWQVYFSCLCWVMISVISMITPIMCSEISSVCSLLYLEQQDNGYMLDPKHQIT